MQNINPITDLNRQHYTVRVRRISQGNLKDAASHAFKRLGVFRHAPELNQLEFVTQQFLCTLWKIPNVLFRVSQPDNSSRYGRS